MVGGVKNSVGMEGFGSVTGVLTGSVNKMAVWGEQGGATMTSTSSMISILGGCLLPVSVKQEYSQLSSSLLGNQLGITVKVRDVLARNWVVVGCLCGMGVCGRQQCQGRGIGQREGSWVAGVDQHHEVAALGQISTSGLGGATNGSEQQHRVAAVWQFSSRRSIH